MTSAATGPGGMRPVIPSGPSHTKPECWEWTIGLISDYWDRGKIQMGDDVDPSVVVRGHPCDAPIGADASSGGGRIEHSTAHNSLNQ